MGVVSVERVDIALPNGTSTVTTNLTKSQNEAKCIPFASFYRTSVPTTGSSDDHTINQVDVEVIDNSGTPALRCTVTNGTDGITVRCYVVEFGADITVQQGTFDNNTADDTVAVTSVDQTKAFLVFYYKRASGDVDALNSAAVRGFFSADDELTFARGSGGDGQAVGHWYIAEDDASNWDVESGTIAMTTETSLTDTITAVVMAKTFIVASYMTTHDSDDVIGATCRVDLSTTTTVRAIRNSNADNLTVSFFAIEFAGDENVYRGLMSFTTGAQDTDTHTAVDEDFGMAWSPVRQALSAAAGATGTASSDVNQILISPILNGTDDGVIADRSIEQGGTQNADFAWEVVEWIEESGAHTGTGAFTLPFLALAATGVMLPSGVGASTLPFLAFAGTGVMLPSATGAPTLPFLLFSGVGAVPLSGTGAPTLPFLVFVGSGAHTHKATGEPTLPFLVFAGSGSLVPSATGVMTLPFLVFVGVGSVPPTATGAPILPFLTFAASGLLTGNWPSNGVAVVGEGPSQGAAALDEVPSQGGSSVVAVPSPGSAERSDP